jgi:hypothetical protein
VFSRPVSLEDPQVVEEGMALALETFWLATDGWSAARIEEQLGVTADGCEVITRFPVEDLVIAGGSYDTARKRSTIREPQSYRNADGVDGDPCAA